MPMSSEIIEFDSPLLLVGTGSNLIGFNSPILLHTYPVIIPCDECDLNKTPLQLFIDWDLNEFLVCITCHEKLMYGKIQLRRDNPYYFKKQEVARKLGVPYP